MLIFFGGGETAILEHEKVAYLSVFTAKMILLLHRYCCSDWKFLALVYRLNGASAKFFGLWCFCTKDLISNLDSMHS